MMLNTKAVLLVISAFSLMILGLNCNRTKNVYLSFDKYKISVQVFVFTVIILYFWLCGVCVKESYDLTNYRLAYDGRIPHGKEPLFDSFSFVFHDAGWSFYLFKAVWISIISILLYKGINKYSHFPGAVAGLALITIFSGFITQMRNALVGVIFLNAFPLVLSSNKRKRLFFVLIMLLSASIHIIGLAYLVFIAINPRSKRFSNRLYYIVILCFVIIAVLLPDLLGNLISHSMSSITSEGKNLSRIIRYFSGEGTHFRYAVFLAVKHLFLFYLTASACDLLLFEASNDSLDYYKIRAIREANALMLIFLPITILSASFERLFNCFSIIQYSVVFMNKKASFLFRRNVYFNIKLRNILVLWELIIFVVQLYFSSSDMIIMLNSFEWFPR